MSKKTARPRATRPTRKTVAVTAAAPEADLPLIEVPAGGTLRAIVDVGPMGIPYAVAYAGRTVIKALVDRSEPVAPLQPGDRLMTWSFTHIAKGWLHTIAVSVNDGPPHVLETRSEANKDPDHSVGVAIVRTGAAS